MYTSNLDIWIGLFLVANQPNSVVKKKVLHLMKNAHPGTKARLLGRILKARLMGKEVSKAIYELEGPDRKIKGYIAEGKDGFVQIVYGGLPVLYPIQIYAVEDDDVTWAHENEETIMLTCAEAVRQEFEIKQLTARVFLFSEAGWSGKHETVTVVEPAQEVA